MRQMQRCLSTTRLVTSCVAVLLLLATTPVAALFERSADAESTYTPLADMVVGRWRIDVPDADFTPSLRKSIADDRPAANSLASVGESVVSAALDLVVGARMAFNVELSPSLLDGVFVGRLICEQHGFDYIHDILSGPESSLAPPLVQDDDSRRVIDIRVTCVSLGNCIVHLGTRANSSLVDDNDEPSNVVGTATLNLQRTPDDPTKTKVRIGTVSFVSTDATVKVQGSLMMMPQERLVATFNSPRGRGIKRLVLQRVAASLTDDENKSWLGSWSSVAMYGVLMLVVVGGRFGVKWYFKRQGVDVDQLVRNIRSGKHERALRKNGANRKHTDEEIRKMMEQDDAAEAWYKATSSKKGQ
jgi:hypothetical protein